MVSQGKGFLVDVMDTGTTHKTAEAFKTMFQDYKARAERTLVCLEWTLLCCWECQKYPKDEDGVGERRWEPHKVWVLLPCSQPAGRAPPWPNW